MRRLRARLSSESGLGLVEVVAALALFAIASTALTDVLTSSVNAHGFATQQTLGQDAADAQIENIRGLPYDQVGTIGGNPPGAVKASQAASTLGVSKLIATVTTEIHYVGDGIPGGYNQLTNYKEIAVTVTRNSDSRRLASETTFIAPPTRAPYGGINQVALGVTVTDIGDNSPVSDVPIALGTGPSAPRSDTTDTNGAVLFAGMTANPTSGPTAYYTVTPTIPSGYQEMSGDVTQAQLAPGQLASLTLRVYQPSTIYVNLTQNGSPYTANPATVTVTPPSGPSTNYTVTGGSGSITGLIPNGQYTLSATTPDGLQATSVTQSVPNDYPTDNTSTFNLALTRPNGTLSVTASNGGTPIAGVAITVSGGPNSITLTGTTDSSGVANFPTVPSGTPGYTVSGIYGAANFSQTGVVVPPNGTKNVILGVPANSLTVNVKAGGTAVPNVSVTLTGPNGFSANGTTDGSGNYTFQNVGQGSGYSVLATDGAATASQGSITIGTSPQTVNLSIPVGSIKATVKDGSGNPIQGASVTLTGPNSLSITNTTNASGVYQFDNIGQGTNVYTVTAKLGAATASNSGLSVSGSLTSTNLTLTTGSVVATVTLGGSALSGAAVTLTGPNSFSASGTTSGSGTVTFSGVGTGSGYALSTSYGPATVQQTGLTVNSGSNPFSLAIPVGSVQVTVTSGGSPLAGATVTLTGAGGYSAPSGTTNSSGQYTFSNVPAGAGYTAGASFGTATASQSAIVVSAGSTATPTLALANGSIKTTVTLGGSPLASQTVTITKGTLTKTGSTDSSGNVTISGLPASTGYTVATTYGSTVQQTPVTVTSGGTTNVTLAIQAGALKLVLTNQGGTAISGATVTLASTNGITAPSGTTNSSGNYTFANLPTGSGYTITATYGGGSVTSSSQTVSNGTTTSVSLTINGTVSVTVKNQSGTGLNGASVTLNGPNSFSATGTTSGGGAYSFSNVPAGSGYTVTAAYGAGSATSSSLTVSNGSTTSANVTINTGTVSVTVSLGGSGFSGATVSLTGANGFSTSATTSASGTVSFSNVPAGNGYTASTSVGAATVANASVNVTSGSTTSLTLTIPVGTVSVTVSLNGSGVSGATVALTGPNSFLASGTTSASGTVSFSNVPAGSGYTASTSVGAATQTGSANVTSGNTTNVTLAIPFGTLVVTVKRNASSCNTVSSSRSVNLTGPNGYAYPANPVSTSPGQATFTNVPAGSGGQYTATVTSSGATNTVTVNTGSNSLTVCSA